VGNDFDLSYERLAVAARVAARGAPLVTPNLDPRLPIEGDDFLPGCGAIVAAVAVTAGVTPVVVGKPEPPLFRMALARLGVTLAEHVLTPLEIIGETIAQKYGPSRVLVIGARETAEAVARGGHAILSLKDHRDATVVVVGNDFDLSYERLAVAARVAARGAPLVTPNLDPRLPIEGDDFLPGCGAIVAAVAVTAGVTPVVVGKPEPPLFRIALARIGVSASEAAMVGDSVASDMRGAHAVGMATVLYAPAFAPDVPDLPAGTVVVRSFAELGARLGLA